jgi:hypothetical protein
MHMTHTSQRNATQVTKLLHDLIIVQLNGPSLKHFSSIRFFVIERRPPFGNRHGK